jgi:predicted acyltransferase
MRLTSLDVFRGITIALMILVNMAGVADNCYAPLDHAPWNGWTPTDLVFPFFLFAVGLAMSLSFRKHFESGASVSMGLYGRILKRSAILFGLGVLINGFYKYDLGTIRIMGVLQRISLVYLLASMIVLNLKPKAQWMLAAAILIGYWLALRFVPVPGYGPGILTREGNLGAFIDRFLIARAHLYKGDSWANMGDPEGLFGTLPAVVSTLIGYFTGEWLRAQERESRTSMSLVFAALLCLAAGKVWGWDFPINKKMWTSSYVLFMGGMALLLFSALYEWIEVRRERRGIFAFEVMGLNSIAVFTASVFEIKILVKTNIGETSAYDWINSRLFVSWLGPWNGPTAFALFTVGMWWLVLYGMHRRRAFIRI